MLCDAVAASLIEGRPLSPIEEAHAAACSSCSRLVPAVRAHRVVLGSATPVVPSPSQLLSRLRAARVRTASLVLLAAGLLTAVGAAFLPPTTSPPATPLIATVDDPATQRVDGADAGLLALVSGLDALEAKPSALPGADLVDLLDPFAEEPLYNPLNPRSTEGEL